MVRDLLAGVLLTVEGQFDIGDTIMVGDTAGKVEDLTLRVTRLRVRRRHGVVRAQRRDPEAGQLVAGLGPGDGRRPGPGDRRGGRTVLDAIRAAADTVTNDPRYAPLCLEPPRLWGVVATAADTFTCRVSVRTPTAERERVARLLRQEIAVGLQAQDVFAAVPTVVAAPATAQPPAPDDAS